MAINPCSELLGGSRTPSLSCGNDWWERKTSNLKFRVEIDGGWGGVFPSFLNMAHFEMKCFLGLGLISLKSSEGVISFVG